MVNLAPKLVSLEETFSIPELQQRTITRMTGTEIAAHNAAAEPLNIYCIEDGAGFLKGHFYGITEDGIITDLFAVHDHSSTATGGTLYEIKRGNYKNIIEMDMSLNIYAAAFWKSVSGAGTLVDNVDTSAHTKYVIATTATANNDYVNGEAGGGRLFFGKPITLQVKYAISNNTSVTYRMGCGQPLMQSNVGVTSQMGFEGCTGTDVFNHAFSADGTTWSAGIALSDMVQASPMGLRIDYYPSSKIVATDGLGTFDTKTDNLPPIGTATNADATCRIGVKTLTTAARNLKVYALRLVGDSYDSQSGIGGWV